MNLGLLVQEVYDPLERLKEDFARYSDEVNRSISCFADDFLHYAPYVAGALVLGAAVGYGVGMLRK